MRTNTQLYLFTDGQIDSGMDGLLQNDVVNEIMYFGTKNGPFQFNGLIGCIKNFVLNDSRLLDLKYSVEGRVGPDCA